MPQPAIQQAFDLARQHHQANRLQQAEQIYRQILSQQPNHADALHYLGLVAHQAGQNEIAVELIRRSIAISDQDPEAYNDLGLALRAGGLLDEAINAFRQAILLKPGHFKFHNHLGISLNEKGQLGDAIAAFRQAIVLKPDYAEAHNNFSIALRANGQLNESIAACRKAIALRPGYADAYGNLGVALRNNGQLDEAVAAYRQGIAAKPNYPQAYNNLGNVLKDKGQLDEAMAAYRQAMVLSPKLATPHSNLVFCLNYHPGFDARAIAEEHRRWNDLHAEPLRKFILPFTNDRDPDRRLRIGYVSPDFRVHVVGRNLLPLFHRHDHRQFEIFCYAQISRPDEMTRQFQQLADGWRTIFGLSDHHVAGQIKQDKIDILVDLALHTTNNRLLIFARKPAPVQATFAGYPDSTGLSTIDCRLSDRYLDPPGMDESIYSEQTIRLPDSFWCYDPGECRDIPVNSLPALKSNAFTFGCLNNFCKIHDGVLRLWTQVMREIENASLLLLAPEGSHRQRTLDRLRQEGIDPSRIDFIPRQSHRKYLEVYHRIDLGLDSFPYNGHTTSLDSFWMGVPVVTLVADTTVSRAGWSQLSNLKLTELAGHTPEQFVRIAVDLARDLPRLKELRSTLRQRMEQSPLMDAPRFAANIEAAYRKMWQRWCATPLANPVQIRTD